MADIGHLAAELSLDGGDFNKSLNEVVRQLGSLSKEVRSTDSVLKLMPNDLEAIEKQSSTLSTKVVLLTQKQKALGEQFKTVTDSMKKNSDGTLDLENSTVKSRNAFAKLSSEMSVNENEIKKTIKQQDILKDKANEVRIAMDKQNGVISVNSDALKDNNSSIDDAVRKQKNLKDSVNDAETALKNQADAYDLVKQKAELSASKVESVQGVANGVGNVALATSGAVIGGAGYAAKLGMDRQSINSGILRVSNVEDQDKFLTDIEEIFSKSMYENYADFGQVWEQIGAAGIQGWENQLAAYDSITALTVASGNDTAEVAQLITSNIGLLHLTSEEVGKYASALASAGNAGSSTDEQVQTMAMKIAGLSTMDVSASNIATLSSFYSSAGIQPDVASSSSVSVFNSLVNANNDATDGGLTYAKVLGVTNEEYDKLRKQDPSELFQLFIEGMAKLKDEGYAINDIMEQLGVDSSQDQNLLRLSTAQASTFQGIQTQVSDAWNSGDSATKEYDTKAATAEAQLQIRKNALMTDIMDVGESLLPVILDLLEAAEPLFDMVEKFSEWFVNLDEDSKKLYTNIALGTFAVGLLTKGFAALLVPLAFYFKLIGNNAAIGKMATEIAKVTSSLNGGVTATNTFNASASTATGQVTALSGSFSGLLATLGAFGGLATAVVGVSLLINHAEDMYEFNKSTLSTWLDKLDEEMQTLVKDRRKTVLEVDTTVSTNLGETVTEETAEKVTKATEKAQEKAKEDYDEAVSKTNTAYANAGVDGTAEKDARLKAQEDAQLSIDEHYKKINDIHKLALDENRALTYDEMALLKEYKDAINVNYADIQGVSQEEKQAIYKSLSDTLTTGVDDEAIKEYNKTLPKTIKNLTNSFNDSKSVADSDLKNGLIDQDSYYRRIAEIEASRQASMEDISMTYYDTLKGDNKIFDPLKKTDLMVKQQVMGETGISSEEFNAQYAKKQFDQQYSVNSDLQATDAGKESANLWNSFFDEEIGYDFVADPLKQVRDYVAGEGGIQGIQSIIANNNIPDEVELMISESVAKMGKWNELTVDEKKLLIDDDDLFEFTEKLSNSGIMQLLTGDEQSSLVNAKDTKSAMTNLLTSDSWESIDNAKRNEAMGTNLSDDVFKSIDAIDGWNSKEIRQKVLTIDYSDYDKADSQLTTFIDRFGSVVIPKKEIEVDANPALVGTNAALSYLNTLKAQDRTISFTTGIDDGITQVMNTILNGLRTSVPAIWELMKGLGTKVGSLFGSIGTGLGKLWDGYTEKLALQAENSATYAYYASGTSYHSGGLAVLGDGGKAEPFLTPSGFLGLSPSTDTLMNLPTGSKVWSSINDFKLNIPHFSNGTDYSFLDGLGNSTTDQSVNLTVNMAAGAVFPKEDQRSFVKAVAKELSRDNKQLRRAGGGN